MADNRAEAQAKLMAVLEAKKRGISVPGGTKPAAGGVPPGGKSAPQAASAPAAARPTAKKPAPQPIKLAPPPAANATTLGKALLVDANKRASQTLANLLKTRRVDCIIAETGAAALQILNDTKPMMILVDKDLPDIGGFNLCSKIRALPNGLNTCIIMTSEGVIPGMRDQALMMDANGYLGKPVNYADLITILQEFREEQKKQAGTPTPPAGQ